MNTLQSVFITVLNMSITASYVTMGIILIRLLLRKTPKVFSYALWSAVLIRLIFPVSFMSAFSYLKVILPKTKHAAYIPNNIGLMQTPTIDVGINGINNAANSSLPKAAMAASVNPMQIVLAVSSIVWIIGMILLILYGIVSYLKVINTIKTATLVKDEIFESDRISTPFVCGLIKPKIYVPTNIPQTELAYILAHERVHIKRLDYLIKPFSFLVLALHWFNPLMWLSFWLMSQDMEMSCDEKVLNTYGYEIKKDYSNTLLAFAAGKRLLFSGSPLAFGENSTAARIKNILNYKKPPFLFVITLIILILVLILLFTANPKSDYIDTTSMQSISANSQATNDGKILKRDLTADWRSYKNLDYGYILSYPPYYDIDVTGGLSPLANPEFGLRVSLSAKNTRLDVDAIDKVNFRDKYQSIDDYINYKHLALKPDETIAANSEQQGNQRNITIYKLENDSYYYVFFENDKYIFQISSNSKDALKKITPMFSLTVDLIGPTSPQSANLVYSNRDFNITLQYPSTWKANNAYGPPPRYEDNNGFFQVSAMSGDGWTIDQVAESDANHILEPYGTQPLIQKLEIQGQNARLILPSDDQPKEEKNAAELIVKSPKVLQIGESKYNYLILWVDKNHIGEIAKTIKFIDANISPENTIFEKDKVQGDWKETVVISDCSVKNGPGKDYSNIGNLKYGDTILLQGSYNGWFLAGTNNITEFWVEGKNVADYDYTHDKKLYGVVTAEKVTLGQLNLEKGNLVWILKKDADRAYVRPVAIDINAGYSGWISNTDFTMDKQNVYFNQAFLKKDAKVYQDSNEKSGLNSDFTDFNERSGGYIFINKVQDNGWVYISAFGGISGWVKSTDIYLP